MRRGMCGAAVTAVMGLALPVALAPQGQAASSDAVNTFRNQETGQCLSAGFGGPYASACNGSPPGVESWNVHVWNDGTRRLQSRFSGKCLDDSAAYGLRMFDCNSETFQSWYVKRWNDGTIELRNQATGKCLDHSAAYGLRTFSCNSSRFQSWF
ncbi:RICIN domain-containing protein [Streptomyces sp. Z26]|uniref:RICIN domain-containing protein n=1 Tax=Streptomyces sp. Z26 TaxID=2500177 RepID=UPI000EF15B1A|nr:RICIN domain-containing protein [Streptomyces sp. Z26]RLL68061.1 hypothetical protein D7M15_15815 [Streptomyces sp. Z26]